MNNSAALLRIRIMLHDTALHCEWALLARGQPTQHGAGKLDEVPAHKGRVAVILPAAAVFLTRRQLPPAARRQHSALLAYAVEDVTVGDPLGFQVSVLGTDAAGISTLAVTDKAALLRWHEALSSAGLGHYELYCETLLLPWVEHSWSLAWNGSEGFVRTAHSTGGVTDTGDTLTPPLALELLLETARAEHTEPLFLTIYTDHRLTAFAKPDLTAWSTTLGLELRHGGDWNWTEDSGDAGPALVQHVPRWNFLPGLIPRLRPALMVLAFALGLHLVSVWVEQAQLGAEQRELRAQLEQRFRTLFPDAVAVVDPVLQLRRQLSTARQAGGVTDNSDFLPLLERVAQATRDLPPGALRSVAWENGLMTLVIASVPELDASTLLQALREMGLRVEAASTAVGSTNLILTVQAT